VNADEREEIAASVAAHAELGSRYDGAVAEGLVERIGDEIDRRVEARLRGFDPNAPRQEPRPQPQPRPNAAAMAQHMAPNMAPATAQSAAPVHRRSNGWTGMILGLGSMGVGIGATAVVVSHNIGSAAEFFMVLLIWAAIAVINVAHSRRN
jgi:hypothetical protein